MPYYIRKKKSEGSKKRESGRWRSVSSLVKSLDKVFSEFIRLRDSKPYDYKYCKCISCGRILPYEDFDAGHFHSRIHMATRFNEDNVHAECRRCNRFSADHLIDYQVNLIRKIGQKKFDALNIKARSTYKYSPWELEILIKHYKDEIKKMKEEKK